MRHKRHGGRPPPAGVCPCKAVMLLRSLETPKEAP